MVSGAIFQKSVTALPRPWPGPAGPGTTTFTASTSIILATLLDTIESFRTLWKVSRHSEKISNSLESSEHFGKF